IVLLRLDLNKDNVFETAKKAKVLEQKLQHAVREELEDIKTMNAVFDRSYVPNLNGHHVKEERTKAELAKCLMDDIENFKEANDCSRVVVVWSGSTERYFEASEVHQTIEAFEEGLQNNDPAIAPSMIYAYAAIK